MKLLQTGNKYIVMSHISHWEFTPAGGETLIDEATQLPGKLKEIPALLTIFLDRDNPISFSDNEAEEAHAKLKEIFS